MCVDCEKYKTALQQIADMDGYDERNNYIDEWTEAAAFNKARQIAQEVLK